jgi:predicted small metal-binding protein
MLIQYLKFKSLDEADIHDKFSDELLQSIVDDIKKNKEETEMYHKYIKHIKKQLK